MIFRADRGADTRADSVKKADSPKVCPKNSPKTPILRSNSGGGHCPLKCPKTVADGHRGVFRPPVRRCPLDIKEKGVEDNDKH
jgi:hypothetical protein